MSAAVAVLHLVWAPLGTEPLARFAEALARHPAGREHELVAILNGFDSASDAAHRELLAGTGARVVKLEQPLLDLAAYRAVADDLDGAEYVCMLNSYAEPLVDNWLELLVRHLDAGRVGMVGATGSYESLLTGASLPLQLARRPFFPSFPNPHLRVTGFALRRDLMRSLRWPRVRRKEQAWRLEAGRSSVSVQVRRRGLRTLVAAADGRAYDVEEWPTSRTFRDRDQSNLLIADNRTREYAHAGEAERERLARLAWGEFQAP